MNEKQIKVKQISCEVSTGIVKKRVRIDINGEKSNVFFFEKRFTYKTGKINGLVIVGQPVFYTVGDYIS